LAWLFRRKRTLLRVAWAASFLVGTSSFGHPTDQELRAAVAEREGCEVAVGLLEPVDRIHLGMSESELKAAHPDVQHETSQRVADDGAGRSAFDLNAAGGKDRGLDRWTREGASGVMRFEYELWQGQVYTIRWRLDESFERPVLDEYGRRAAICFGAPEYDQTFEAEPGSAMATLRRIGWTHGDRRIELRQLHPLRGGPVYLTVTRTVVIRDMAAAGVARYPDPDRSGPWWERPTAAPQPAKPDERTALGHQFVELLAQIDH
jgi:hypothetical protein